jgi:transglutaminase-like putative cysteine protease
MLPAAPLYGVIVVYGPAALNPFGGSGLLDSLQRDVPRALETMYAQPVPYEMQPGLSLLLAPVVVLVCGLSASATLHEGSPVFSIAVLGVTLGVISTVGFEAGVGPYFAGFLTAAVALLLLTTGSGLAGLGTRGVVAAAVVVGAALVLPQTPLAKAVIQPALVDWTEIGTGQTSRLATEADVGPYLESGRDAELMMVRSPEPLYWRGGTLDEFDGVRWSSTVGRGEGDGDEIGPGVETETVPQSVEILEAETGLVFGGYNIQDVSVLGAEQKADGSWSVAGKLEQGERYGVVSEVPQPTSKQLSEAGVRYPEEVRSRFLQMPADRPREIADTARTIERDYAPGNPYETARAIERYLLYDGGFTYNLAVDYRRADRALESFLGEGREGFCTQFATSMALVAREMGVPTRVVYGATTGEEVNDGEYLVRGENMHTWVEAYFPGVGWYPFDPTPGLGLADAMQENAPAPDSGASSYADDPRAQSPVLEGPGNSPWAESGELSQPATSEDPGATRAGGENGAGTMLYALTAALLAIAVFVPVPLTKLALLRRGRPEDYYRDLLGRLEDGNPGSIPAPASLTPLERLSALARDAGLPEEPFTRFARAYSERLYARYPGSDLAAAHGRALSAYRRLPRWRRVLGAMNPASLLRRGSAALSRRSSRAPWRWWRLRGRGR